MGRKSTRTDKNLYQLSREEAGLTREGAGDEMGYVTEDRIEKIERGVSEARPEEVLEMAKCYHDPLLCNRHCTEMCPIGRRYVPVVKERELSDIAEELADSVENLYEKRDRLVDIAVAEEIPDDSMDDLIEIGITLNRLRGSAESLQLWLKKGTGKE